MITTAIVDKTFAALAEEVEAAEKSIIEVAERDPGKWWYPYELRQLARNEWSPGAMGIALDNLTERGVFRMNADLCVRLCD
jgi:hypothetical protein